MEPCNLAAPASMQGVFMNSGHRHHRSSCIGYVVHRSVAVQSLFEMTVLCFLLCVDLNQVDCVRAVQNVCNHVPVLGAVVNIGGGKRVRDVFLPRGRLRKKSFWLPKLAAGSDLAAVLGHENDALCRAESYWGTRDGKLAADWRCGKVLSPGDGSSRCFAGKENDRDCSHIMLKSCPAQPVTQDIAQDAGGGGNCMYLSIAAALLEISAKNQKFKNLDSQALRQIAARAIVGFDSGMSGSVPKSAEDTFMGRLGVLAALEKGGTWEDFFSPTEILENDEYTNSTGAKMQTKTIKEKARALYFELSRPGGAHWGMAMDLEALEEQLPMGFIVFNDTGQLYPLAIRRDRVKEVYVLMYYRPGHFQQAGVGVSSATARSALLPEEMPDFIQAIHWVDARTPVFPIPNLHLQAASR